MAKFEKVELLLLGLVDPPVSPLREFIDPEYIRELAESIREIGLLEPVQVRPVNNRYEVVFGHCRYLASRVIGAEKIKAIVKVMSDEEVITAQLVENLQRADLRPIEVAKVFARLRERLGLSTTAIAKRTGKALSTVQGYLKLLELEPEYQEGVNLGRLSMNAALELNKVDDPAQRHVFFAAAIQSGITIEQAKAWVADYEKTKAATYYDGGEGGSLPDSVGGPVIVYHTCGGCRGPVETSQVRMVGLCPECLKSIARR